MDSISALNNSSLYFNAAQSAAAESKRKEKAASASSAKKTVFGKLLEAGKDTEKAFLIEQGLPPEIAGLSEEEATVFLKDAVDMAGDELLEKMTSEAFSKYRTKVKQFIGYIVKNNFSIEQHKRYGFNRKGKPRDPAVQVQVINQKLDNLAADLLYNHMDKLKILAKVGEINGLLVDLYAV
ncbi:MAG: YaaR family protein [Treponema sp.]|jgi:uncharacterized protein YaaR (DUF327 family)|nr:YaaR family protein [Treponema sp.]